ncbi:MAG: 50S ribosomal protein L18 [Candidatus Omnitrophota bacterium]|nr:50S ribosomal protein L18 [Candidatus Omnitrophota bacterium]
MRRKIRSQSELGRITRHYRIRKKLSGTKEIPRLIVHRSHNNIYVQFVDDMAQHTLLSLSTGDASFKKEFGAKGGNIDAAKKMGAYAAKEVSKKGISRIVFDRGGYLYHGRIKALADGAREAGLKF